MSRKMNMSGVETLYDLKVMGDKAVLTATTMGTPHESTIPWDQEILGHMGAWRLAQEKGLKPGTKYSYKTYSFDSASKPITVTSEIIRLEETTLPNGEKKTLHYCMSETDMMPGIKSHEWRLDDCDTIKTEVKMMGILMEGYRSTKEKALSVTGGELKADLMMETVARSNIRIPRPYLLDSILYKFEAKDSDLGIPDNLDDIRQKVIENDGQVAKVLIKAVTPTSLQKRPIKNPPEELLEYLESNAFIQCDHPGLKTKALEVINGETDTWKAACLLEHWVYEYISDKNFGTAFASAGEVFEKRTGDCSEHGVLLAAVCRAVGIPARVAMGYMYLGGIFGGHMWAEVWINGEWYAIDGVMGIGRVDPTHIRFTTSSIALGDMGQSFSKAVTGLGNLEISILEFTRGDTTFSIGKDFKDYVISGNDYTNTLYGISLTKPDNCEFDDYEKDLLSGIDFTLVQLEGETKGELMAMPAIFSFTMDDYRSQITRSARSKIILELPRKVSGLNGRVFVVKTGNRITRNLALITNDTCYSLTVKIKNEERDTINFEKMVNSIKFK